MPFRNVSALRLHDLRALSVVLRERNLTRAAELLDTTQPAISKILARLRSHFGDPLVIRNGVVMQLTPRALEMIEPLGDLLRTSDGLCAATPSFDPVSSERTFSLLVTDVGTVVFVPPVLARLTETGNRLALRAIPLDGRHFETKLESGEADLALGAFPHAAGTLRRQRLYFANYVSVVRKDHPQITRLRTAAGFRSAKHILVMASGVGHAAQHAAQQALEAEITPHRVLLRLPSFIAAAMIAARTDGVATVPENVASALRDSFGLTRFKPPIPLPQYEITQYWHERCHRDPGHRWFRTMTFDLFGKVVPQRHV